MSEKHYGERLRDAIVSVLAESLPPGHEIATFNVVYVSTGPCAKPDHANLPDHDQTHVGYTACEAGHFSADVIQRKEADGRTCAIELVEAMRMSLGNRVEAILRTDAAIAAEDN